MDFDNGEELDYEEDDLHSNSTENCSSNINCEKDENSNTPGCDEYLQIDFSDEENFNLSDGNMETVNAQNQGNSPDKISSVKKSRFISQGGHRAHCDSEGIVNINLNIDARTNQSRLNANFQANEANRFFKKLTFYDRKRSKISTNFKLDDMERKSLQENEKHIMKLKKEARLKRFKHDGIVSKGKKNANSDVDKATQFDLEEPEKSKTAGEIFFRPGKKKNSKTLSLQGTVVKKTPEINKELLLKKRNPFDENSNLSQHSLASVSKLKQENEKNKPKSEFDEFTWIVCKKFMHQLSEEKEKSILSTSRATVQNFGSVKSDLVSCVKFVRTVSKSFDELARGAKNQNWLEEKPRNENKFSSALVVKASPFMSTNYRSCSTGGPSFSTRETESHLIGCIVKVFNIPPSITINDVLGLCRPIGRVREVKLNFPKENSVVIRFEESAYAEKFFTTYHGRKMNNYYLNVIVV